MTDMIKYSNRNNLYLLILLPANETARIYCNQTKSSYICQIKIDSNKIENGLIYTRIKQQQQQLNMNIYENQNIKISKDLINQHRIKINKKLLSSSSSSSPVTTYSNVPSRFSLWFNKKKKK